MIRLSDALWTEAVKARRSRVPWLTLLGMGLAPLVGGLFMMILKDPAWARRAGLITAKAQLRAGTADWPTFWDLLVQALAIGGLIVFALVAIWDFGREWSDRTLKDLLALPTPRASIVLAKFTVIALWSLCLAAEVYLLGLAVGSIVGLPGWSVALAVATARRVVVTAAMAILLVTPFACAASAGRGYLPAIGAMFLVIFLSQVLAATGWGIYFPWSVAGLASGVAGPEAAQLSVTSYALIPITGVLGVLGTIAWRQSADHT